MDASEGRKTQRNCHLVYWEKTVENRTVDLSREDRGHLAEQGSDIMTRRESVILCSLSSATVNINSTLLTENA